MGKYAVDLNSDLGESFGAYTIGMDADVLNFVSSANIACGFHAGDPAVMRKTVALAKERGVSMGAHPGYPDLVGFGRRNMSVSASDMHDYVLYQLARLPRSPGRRGTELVHVKPHGAMYNMAAKDASLAGGGMPRGEGVRCFAYTARPCQQPLCIRRRRMRAYALQARFLRIGDIWTTVRSSPARSRAPMITDEDEAVSRVIKMIKTGFVTGVSSKEIPVRADSVCVHGDGAKALSFTRKIRAALEAEGIAIRPLGEIIG